MFELVFVVIAGLAILGYAIYGWCTRHQSIRQNASRFPWHLAFLAVAIIATSTLTVTYVGLASVCSLLVFTLSAAAFGHDGVQYVYSKNAVKTHERFTETLKNLTDHIESAKAAAEVTPPKVADEFDWDNPWN